MAQNLSPGKSACILAVVIGCFAILWPSIFYPMLKGSVFPSIDRNEYHRQEQSHYLRPNAIHPGLRDQSRVIPQPHSSPPPARERRSIPPPVIAAKKPPIPGLRPPMAGRGNVPSHKDNGPMGILMPLYTVGIVIFFVYTITKLVCKKHNTKTQYVHDPELHRLVIQNKVKESKKTTNIKNSGSSPPDVKLVVSAISSLLQEVNHDILKREMKKEQQEIRPAEDSTPNENSLEQSSNENCAEKQAITENDQSKDEDHQATDLIQVVETEMGESFHNGQSQKHSSEESTEKSSTPKNNPTDIIADEIISETNEPVNLKISNSNASKRNVADESLAILERKVPLDATENDSIHDEADENNTKQNKDMNDEDKENISKNNDQRSEEQDPTEKIVAIAEL